jgi:pimeloyl-ACP methyl ester carboxylesterase
MMLGSRLMSRRTIVNGHPLSYVERGKGSPLLLLHGGGDSGEHSFARQLDALGTKRRLIAPDQVGQGHTPPIPEPLSYRAMMEDTAALLAQLGVSRADAVGFSDGGILALMLAIHHPTSVRRLVVGGANIAPGGLAPAHLEGLRKAQRANPESIGEKLAKLWFTSPVESEINLAALSGLPHPVLLICGDRDVVTLEHTLAIYRALPNAELCVLPGTGHGTFADRAEWLNPMIIGFLDRP